MNENVMGNILAVLYILQIPLLIGVCIYNAKTVKKKDRAAAPFVWLTIGLCVASFFGFTLLWIRLDISFVSDYAAGFLTVLLILCGHAVSVLTAKRALSGEDRRERLLARSLRPEHFANGRAFSRPAFDQWILESRKSLKKAMTAYLCSIAGGILLSILFSEGVGGFGGNIMALLCIFAGLIVGGTLGRKAGKSAENAAAYLGISSEDVLAAKRHLKSGTFAWREDEAAASDRGAETPAREAAPVTVGVSLGASLEKPAELQENGPRPRRKMKKWLKKTLIVAAGVIALFLCLVVIAVIENTIREKNESAFKDCLRACDVGGAQGYAKKLTTKNDPSYQGQVDRMERFLTLYDAGRWQEAIAEYDGDDWFVVDGIAIARYCECYYQTQVLPAETALDEGRVRDAVELLLQFQNRFDWIAFYDLDTETHIGSFEEYSAYFGEHAQHFIDLTTRAAEAAMAAGDEETILLLEGFSGDIAKTVPFEEFPWSADYLAWKEAK